MSPQTQSEALWIGRIADGDRDAFEKLYFAYQRRLFGFLYRVAGDSGAAEELVNDVRVEVWENGSVAIRSPRHGSSGLRITCC